MAETERKRISLMIDDKDEIENEFLNRRIKNYNEGYRRLLKLGFAKFKKEKTIKK